MGISIVIGAILAVSSMNYQEAYATEVDEIMSKIIKIDKNISNLKSIDDTDFNKLTLGKASFEIKQIEKSLLEINELNDKNGDKVNAIYEFIKNEYNSTIEKYKKEVKTYEKENGLTVEEKKLAEKIFKNQITFKNHESKKDLEMANEKLIQTTIKETKAKENYQNLITKISIKVVDEANGSKVQNVYHKIAIKEIIDSKKWNMAIPAIDRIITQTNNNEMKENLNEIKINIKNILDKKEKQGKQNQIFALKNNDEPKSIGTINLIEFEQNIIEDSYILDQIFEDGVIESLTESEKVISEFEEKLEQSVLSEFKESNTLNIIEPIFEAALKQSLVEVSTISDEDDKKVEEKREKQKKEAKEKKKEKKN